MTTNKPEVKRYDYGYTDDGHGGGRYLGLISRHDGKLVRYEDYQALQAECEKLRNLLRHAQPIITAHAEASHMLEGFRPLRNQWDELVAEVSAAIHEDSQ